MGEKREDISETTAPSIGPHTVIEKKDPEERLAKHEQSDVDAMGLDKRREVVGGRYSPSVARQAATYGIFAAVLVAVAIGFVLAINRFDRPESEYPDEAPWAQEGSPQVEPEPIDFPVNGNPGPQPD